MREDNTSRLFARCYGLALGLALGACISTVPFAWRDAVAATCWMAGAEAGLVQEEASCPGLPGFAAGSSPAAERVAVADGAPAVVAPRGGAIR